MEKQTVRDVNVRNKKILVRVDFNVPLDITNHKISDDSRILAAIPTIKYLLAEGSKVILCSHLGRPKGIIVEELRLAPIAKRLSEIFTGFWVDTYVRPKVFLKQLRFYVSKSRFRRAMAKQYVKMAIAMISDTKKLGKDDSRFESA